MSPRTRPHARRPTSSRQGITFLSRLGWRLSGGELTENRLVRDLGGHLEAFAFATRPEKVVDALTEALVRAGAPGAEQVPARALPPGRLSGAPGSLPDEVPGWPRPLT